jgi:hypothetical protein
MGRPPRGGPCRTRGKPLISSTHLRDHPDPPMLTLPAVLPHPRPPEITGHPGAHLAA